VAAWKAAAESPEFRALQDSERDRVYFDPAVSMANRDGLVADWPAPPVWFALSMSLASGVALCILLVGSRSRSRVGLSLGG